MAYNILIRRKEKNLTQEELANLSGISRATISRLENGEEVEVEVKLSTLEAIANALGCAIPDIIT